MIGKKNFNSQNICEYYPNCYYYANEAYPNEIRCIDFTTEEIENVVCPNVIEENIKLKVKMRNNYPLYLERIAIFIEKKE